LLTQTPTVPHVRHAATQSRELHEPERIGQLEPLLDVELVLLVLLVLLVELVLLVASLELLLVDPLPPAATDVVEVAPPAELPPELATTVPPQWAPPIRASKPNPESRTQARFMPNFYPNPPGASPSRSPPPPPDRGRDGNPPVAGAPDMVRSRRTSAPARRGATRPGTSIRAQWVAMLATCGCRSASWARSPGC